MPDSANGPDKRPIERGFPISEVSSLAEREGRAKLHYRPLTTMHKWWARQLGSVFRAICLYALLDDPERVTIGGRLEGDTSLSEFTGTGPTERSDLGALIDSVDLESPEALWELYPRDVRVGDVDVLDPFMGGGTSLLEATRFGASVTGVDLNPVAWFVTKKEFEAAEVDLETLEDAFEQVQAGVSDELKQQYITQCPNDDDHVADVMYALWVRTLDCISCGETIPLFSNYRVAKGRYEESDRYQVICPECNGLFLTDDPATESVCSDCRHEFVPDNGPVSQGGKYGCPSCGLKYPIVDAIADGQSYDEQLYALEYYCTECDDAGEERTTYKGYKPPEGSDVERYEAAAEQWNESDDLSEYAPSGSIPEGAITAASSISGNDIFQHGYEDWRDMFNGRQLYCLSTLLREIDKIDDSTVQEFLLLAFSDSLLFQNNFARYSGSGRKIEGALGRNSYTPRRTYAENNVWGTRAGRGTFSASWEKIVSAVEFAHSPTERYLEGGELRETEPFERLIGGDYSLHQGDMREVPADGTYDAIITDPPYYDNVVYSEVSDFFYVWQRLLLRESYDCFESEATPRNDSIVSNPAEGKDAETFEQELEDAFGRMQELLADDGILTFTYRTGDTDSWGKLVDGLCSEGFDLSALYPVAGNSSELFSSDDLNVTVVVVARLAESREPVSWSALRRKAHRASKAAREQLDESSQSLSEGEASLVELGRCLREYSQHHGQVHRDGEVMDPVDVVAEFEELVTGNVSPDEIYLSLLEMDAPSERDLRRLCYGTEVTPDDLRERGLISTEDGLELAGWDNEARQSYLDVTTEEELTPLDRIHQLRADVAATSSGQLQRQREVEATSELVALATDLASLTNDEEYRVLFNE
jgi:adenine-specific DNA methylase